MGDEGLGELAEATLEVVRDALARIEEQAQKDDDAQWLDLSRRFAVLVSPIREYLNGLQRGRDLPQQLAGRLEPLLTQVAEATAAVDAAGLQAHVDAVERLAAQARLRSP